ncbi:FG-GAP and VCBS repeat-containing protein [Streptomyces sp. NPDC005385]|uniref:FG-GAP and VCBS repeat-containing protein n=1 Tax=Streptomyces sp. NPDC005385 TaxID=3157039 RepID=UPI0033A8368A
MRIRTYAIAVTVAAAATAGLTLAPPAIAAVPKAFVSDFDGDGFADLVVGVPDGTVDGEAKAGYVNVVWGGPKGLGASGNTRVTQARPGMPGTPEKGDRFGAAVSAADVNGDGRADVVIGVPGEDVDGSGADAGTVAVLYGVRGGLGTGATILNGPASSTGYGKSLVAADFTGDGTTDVAIGATDKVVLKQGGGPAVTVFTGAMGGRAPVLATGDFDGSDDGTADLAVGYWSTAPVTQSHVRLWSWSAEEKSLANFWNTDNAGISALAAGDFDGDGHDDLALGECREIADENIDDPCGPEELAKGGGIHIHYGAGIPWNFGYRRQTLNQDTAGVMGVAETDDHFGAALAAADVNGDGRDDLIAGAPGEAIGSRARAGAATLLLGGPTGLVDAHGEAHSMGYQQNTPGVPGAAEAGDAFGDAVATGDYDHDGTPDMAVGSPGENTGSGGVWVLPAASPDGSYVFTPGKLGLPSPSSALKYGGTLTSD